MRLGRIVWAAAPRLAFDFHHVLILCVSDDVVSWILFNGSDPVPSCNEGEDCWPSSGSWLAADTASRPTSAGCLPADTASRPTSKALASAEGFAWPACHPQAEAAADTGIISTTSHLERVTYLIES